MPNLYSLAGQGTGANWATGAGNAASSLAMPAMMMGGVPGMVAGGVLGVGGMLAKLIGGPLEAQARARRGKELYGRAEGKFNDAIANHPNKYSLQGITSVYDRARSDMTKSNRQNTNALLDRYSSIQQRQLRNRISSGLSAGAAQAGAVQNNIAFQQNANRLFQQQAQQASQLRLREGQAKFQAGDVIDARKDRLARNTLSGQGIADPTALAGLSRKLVASNY